MQTHMRSHCVCIAVGMRSECYQIRSDQIRSENRTLARSEFPKENENAMRPISHRLLCAMAKAVFEPTIDDAEWSARIKHRLADQGFTYARPDEITAALRAVERALAREGCRRSVAITGPASKPPASVRPLTKAEATAALQRLQARAAIHSMT
jgi:hypothetical protein